MAHRCASRTLLPPISKNDPKYSFQIYLTHRRACIFLEEQCQRVCNSEYAVLSDPSAVRYTSGQKAAGRRSLGLAKLTTPFVMAVARYLRMCLIVGGCYLFQVPKFVALVPSESICLYSLLARCSLTKTPFGLPVSFSADFNTRLFTHQYQDIKC